jgi:hypothetical protein
MVIGREILASIEGPSRRTYEQPSRRTYVSDALPTARRAPCCVISSARTARSTAEPKRVSLCRKPCDGLWIGCELYAGGGRCVLGATTSNDGGWRRSSL